MRFVLDYTKGAIRARIEEIERPIAEAATAAVTEAGNIAKKQSRAAITGAGFSARWGNALRLDIYPQGRPSMKPAAHLWHKIQYAGIFDEGGTIPGSPDLWLPLPDAPKQNGRPLTPAQYREKIGPLGSVKGKKLLVGRPQRGKPAVPLYFGISAVNIPRKFGIEAIVRRAAGMLGALYAKNVRR